MMGGGNSLELGCERGLGTLGGPLLGVMTIVTDSSRILAKNPVESMTRVLKSSSPLLQCSYRFNESMLVTSVRIPAQKSVLDGSEFPVGREAFHVTSHRQSGRIATICPKFEAIQSRPRGADVCFGRSIGRIEYDLARPGKSPLSGRVSQQSDDDQPFFGIERRIHSFSPPESGENRGVPPATLNG